MPFPEDVDPDCIEGPQCGGTGREKGQGAAELWRKEGKVRGGCRERARLRYSRRVTISVRARASA
jgi:hypothetical protein